MCKECGKFAHAAGLPGTPRKQRSNVEDGLVSVLHEETKDPALYRVYLYDHDRKKGTYIGVVRSEPQGWLPIGGFVFNTAPDGSGSANTYFQTMDEASGRLASSWLYQLSRKMLARAHKE
jgi:hypothetical protein